MNREIIIKKLVADAIIPSYAHENDAGMDVYAAEDVRIKPGQTVTVPTGIALAIPDCPAPRKLYRILS